MIINNKIIVFIFKNKIYNKKILISNSGKTNTNWGTKNN